MTSIAGSRARRAATLLALMALATAVLASGAQSRTRADTQSWSLAAAGYPSVVVRPGTTTRSTRAVTIGLPAGAVQGGNTWYRIHLHYRIELDPQSPPGHVYVDAATDGRPCVMIRFDITRVHGRMRVTTAEIGPDHRVHAANVGLVHEATFVNVLEYKGVRGGRNVVTFTVERLGPARFRQLTIFGDTAIVRSSVGLSGLTLEPVAPRGVRANTPFVLRFRVHNTGDVRTHAGRVDLQPGSGLRQVGRGTFPALRPGAAAMGSLRLLAPHRGRYQLLLVADSTNAGAAAMLDVSAS